VRVPSDESQRTNARSVGLGEKARGRAGGLGEKGADARSAGWPQRCLVGHEIVAVRHAAKACQPHPGLKRGRQLRIGVLIEVQQPRLGILAGRQQPLWRP
jgi:hypothetical protein